MQLSLNMEKTTKNNENKKNESGALWKKTSKAGKQFLSGYFLSESGEKVKIVAFENSYKKAGESSPDYRIYLSEENVQNANAKPTKATSKPATATETIHESSSEDSDEIPF
jgi:uncharacterized protein (DUF736 family)